MVQLPAGVRSLAARGEDWAAWVGELPRAVSRLLDGWDLRPDGDPVAGSSSIGYPVRTAENTPAMLKVSSPGADSEQAHLVLRRWNGDGAVRLLRADPPRRALLLERLRTQTLDALPDIDACEVVARLYRRLHVPPLPQLPTLTSLLERWAADLGRLPRSAPIPHRLVEQAIALCRDLSAEPAATVLHGDLHYRHVLAADRETWLAVAPKPINGDPHYELAPMLWHRWDELAGYVRDGVRRRFSTLVETAGLDDDRARAFVVVRVVREATGDPSNATKYVALAKAVQD